MSFCITCLCLIGLAAALSKSEWRGRTTHTCQLILARAPQLSCVCVCLAYNHQSDRPSLWSFCQTTGDRLRFIPPTDQKPSSDKPGTCTSRRKPVLHCMSELIFRVIFHLLIWQVSTSLSVLLSVILSFSPFTLKSESTYSSLCLEDSHFNIRNPFSPSLRVLVAH